MRRIELEAIISFYGGSKWLHFFDLIEKTIKGVVSGALLTALAQGILAGIFTFGLIGLFIGPVIIAVVQAFWKDLVASATEIHQSPNGAG